MSRNWEPPMLQPCEDYSFTWYPWNKTTALQNERICDNLEECAVLKEDSFLGGNLVCENILVALSVFATSLITSYEDMSLLTLNKKDAIDTVVEYFLSYYYKAKKIDIIEKITVKNKSKIDKMLTQMRNYYLNNLEKLDLTKISEESIIKIAKNAKAKSKILLSRRDKEITIKREQEKQEQLLGNIKRGISFVKNTLNPVKYYDGCTQEGETCFPRPGSLGKCLKQGVNSVRCVPNFNF